MSFIIKSTEKSRWCLLLIAFCFGISAVLASDDVAALRENIVEIPNPNSDSDYEYNQRVRALKEAVEERDIYEAGKDFIIYERDRASLENWIDELIKKTNVLIRNIRNGRGHFPDKTLLHWVKENLEHEKERASNAGRRLTIEQNTELLWQVVLNLITEHA